MIQTKSIISRSLLTLIAIGASCLLFWYGVFSYQVGTRNVDFVLKHSSSSWFPIVQLWKGNAAYFVDLDPANAVQHYKRAISEDVLLIDAWLALARTEISMGNSGKAAQIVQTLAPVLANSTTWKWRELLLAYDLKNEQLFNQGFNFILEKMPARRQDAIYLAQQFWSTYEQVSTHVSETNSVTWLESLIRLKQPNLAFDVWQQIQDNVAIQLADRVQMRLCNFLIGQQKIPEARRVWSVYTGVDSFNVYNGGFESELVGSGLGWRLNKKVAGVVVRRTTITSFEGAYSLQFRFDGKENVNYYHLYQIVPVEPSQRYQLHFAHKSRNLTTDEGLFLQVAGWHCKGLNILSSPVTGTEPWKLEELEFVVPDQCNTILLRVRRKESLMFDNKISGEYWLDNVGLLKLEPSPDDPS